MSYLKKVLELAGKMDPGDPQIHHFKVCHDDWCAIFNGDPCNCDPDVEMMKPPLWFATVNN